MKTLEFLALAVLTLVLWALLLFPMPASMQTTVINGGRIQIGARQLAEIYQATVTLTDAQIKAEPTTSITLVAAPGAGFAIEPLYALIYVNPAAGAYTNLNAAGSLTIKFSGVGSMGVVPNDVLITTGSATRLSDLLGTTTPRSVRLLPRQDTEGVDGWGAIPPVVQTSLVTNAALVLTLTNGGSGNLTGGNVANSLTVLVTYLVLPVP